eukprot:CAMPEP_0201546020 /NCGR_PEP_ID=MMETSP0173_2-20130828/2419_1 /ASSEMBLY_ACC=CAM_ASM_000268 /TAXON_ID=218659 /ORGANISM="Vexillifera sp., Strain DIVA3 564/2" /LENGTH=223 /DNA_ID=CAMNT_0047954597 /DNA_START=48 /DNA_END=717 /DNA_ORIENTATION=+
MSAYSMKTNQVGNNEQIERAWAEAAGLYCEQFSNKLARLKDLKDVVFTPVDDQIYNLFRQRFPDYDVKSIPEDVSRGEKPKLREFCEEFKNTVDNYNFGTLLRKDAYGDFTPDNTIVVVRIVFYAIELARCREGTNKTDWEVSDEAEKQLQQETMLSRKVNSLLADAVPKAGYKDHQARMSVTNVVQRNEKMAKEHYFNVQDANKQDIVVEIVKDNIGECINW